MGRVGGHRSTSGNRCNNAEASPKGTETGMIKLRPFVPVVCSVALLLTTSAQAQINPFRSGSRAGLRPNDIKLMEEAASKLLAKPDLRVGSTEAWSSDSTGASGTVSVE